MQWALLLVLGVSAGVLSGLFGIGGGLLIVPALVILFGFAQQTATATSLVALLFPVGALAAWTYWQEGKISSLHVLSGCVIAAGMLIGGLIGARVGIAMDPVIARRTFAVFLALVAVKLWVS
jgi:uncharacterized membrane protein YfcA